MTDPVVADAQERAERFLSLHVPGRPLLMPNPWDVGSARLLEHLGFEALATTSSGHAAVTGRLDGSVTEEESLVHAGEIVEATSVPVSADLEDGFSADPAGVAATVAAAAVTGLAGCSIEDDAASDGSEVYDAGLARERIEAAADAAHRGPVRLVLTARADGVVDDDDGLTATIDRLVSYAEAGADVLYAPRLPGLDAIRRVVESVDRPVNVLAKPDGPTVAALAEVGVARVSVGGLFNVAALGAVVGMARALQDDGVIGLPDLVEAGMQARGEAFTA